MLALAVLLWSSPPDTLRVSTDVRDGWRLFHIHCFRCHGYDAEGGAGPDLRLSAKHFLDRETLINTVLNGRPVRGMPAWREVLSADDAALIREYLLARGNGLPTGKPAIDAVYGEGSGPAR